MLKTKQYHPKSLYFPERITEAITGIFGCPLTIVEAPMGYGKTTAVREYLNKTDAHVLWQMVYDKSMGRFWKGFSRLFAKLDEDCSLSLMQLGFPNDPVLMQEALRVIEEVELSGETVLVIDDYHLIESSEVNRLFEFLAINEIINLRIVLIARFTGLQNREELALKGYLHCITKETFEFAPKEIAEYYKTCGISLKDFEADKLYLLTEGWISALYLFMMEYIAEGGYTPEKNIYKLLEKAIYMPLSEEIKDFLLMMCLFDSFSMEQAVYMWEKENTAELLDEITNKNAFVKYDGSTKTFYAHNIFTGFLKEALARKNTRYKLDLYQKAARWCLKTGDYLAARHYFYQCGDFDSVLTALEDDGINFNAEKKEQFQMYMDECPKEVKDQHPYALLKYAMNSFVNNETVLFGKLCGEFNSLLKTGKNLNDELRNRLLGEFELILSFTTYNDLKKMSVHHRRAWELLNQPTSIYDTRSNWTFGSPSVLYLYYRESGRLEEHVKELTEALVYYTRLTNGHGSGAEYAMEAERYFNTGDFVNTEILLHQALYHSQLKKQTGITVCAMFLQIRLAFIKSDFSGMMDLLEKIRAKITSERQYLFIHTVDMCEGYIYSLLSQKDKIPVWIRTGSINSSRLFFPVFGMFNIIFGRVMLINGEYLKLIGSAEHFISIVSVFPNLLGQIYTYIYLAAAKQKIFKDTEALANLQQALEIAMPDKVYLPFVENCDYIKPLLEKIYYHGRHQEGITQIFELYAIYRQAAEQIISEHFSGEPPKLTERELEIARLAAEGLTNKEIGARLYISENTVKKQLKRIFEKLGITSRILLKQSFDKLK